MRLLQQHRDVTPNLPSYPVDLMLWLKDHIGYIVVEGDKNLGLYILERSYYIWSILVILTNNYKELTADKAFSCSADCNINSELDSPSMATVFAGPSLPNVIS